MAFQIFLVLFLVLNALRTFDAAAEEHDSDPDTRWESFKKTYHKTYSAEEEELRRKNFEENYRKISEHNQRYEQGMYSFYLGVNEYSDMLIEEITSTMNRLKPFKTVTPIPFSVPDCPVPDAVDWRNESAVTPVKNQGQCGSCYAFSATGALEGQHKLKRGKLVSLSEQNIVDCSYVEGNGGCYGGYMDKAFEYIRKNGGIDSEESYPYRGMMGYCQYDPEYSAAKCSGFSDLPSGNETILQMACACVGPISVVIDASHDSFKDYKGGIYNEPDCDSNNMVHAVLVIGYGTEDGQDYWLIKNSYGTSWGMDGYMKMARNNNNMCGIATLASYPVL